MINEACLIYNYAQHYRSGIFIKMDKELEVDFYFGDKMQDVKKMDYEKLSHFKKELKNVFITSHIYWQSGSTSLFFNNYKQYIILGDYYCLSTWVLLFLCKFSNKKVYLWTHGWYGNENFFKRIIKKWFFKLSDGVLLYGKYAKKLMINEGFNSEKLHVIYNSMNYETQLNVRKKTAKSDIYEKYFKNNFPVMIFIGRLTKVKELTYLLEIQERIEKKGLGINIIYVGEGEDKKRLKKLAANKNVWFYGACYDEEKIGNLIYNADLCVSPGNVGLTAMHSMVYGTPVFTNDDFSTQMPEFEAIESNVTGGYFKKNNLDSMVTSIYNWLILDKNREEIRENCYKKIDKYYNPNFQIAVLKNILNE